MWILAYVATSLRRPKSWVLPITACDYPFGVDVTDATFEDAVVRRSAEVPIVVDFWAEWCGPCHALTPVLEEAVEARAGAVELAKLDVDANPDLSERFDVRGIPAVKAFRDGRVVAEFTGARPSALVDSFLDELLAPPRADVLLEELTRLRRAAGGRRRRSTPATSTARSNGSSTPSRAPQRTSASVCARSPSRSSTAWGRSRRPRRGTGAASRRRSTDLYSPGCGKSALYSR